jgi:hypothetical protein
MNSSRLKKFGGLLAVLALLIIVCPMAARAYVSASPGTEVSIPDASANSGHSVTVAISVTNVTLLGGATIFLHYTPGVVHVTSVAEGNLGGTFLSTIDNVTGITNMTWFSATGMNGNFTFANVTLYAVGSPGDTSPLNLEVITLANVTGAPIIHTTDNGTFTITGVPPTPPTPSGGVGGTAYPPNKLVILAPWIALAAAIIAGSTIFLRRRRAQG